MRRLAKPGDPYVTVKGEVRTAENEPENVKPSVTMQTPIARSMKIGSVRSVNELPCSDTSTQTAINAIMMYHLMGLTQNEIAFLLKLDVVVVQNLMYGSEFQDTFEIVFNEMISVNSNSLQATIGKLAHSAINQIAELHVKSKNDMVRLKASQDLADRAGLDPEVLYEKKSNSNDEGFKVVVVEENDGGHKTSISIDVGKKR